MKAVPTAVTRSTTFLKKLSSGKRGAAVDDQVEAVESRRDELVAARLGEEVTGQLVADEVVVAEVVVERADHPVAVGDIVPVEVLVHAVGVGEADQVEPVARHVLAVLRLRRAGGRRAPRRPPGSRPPKTPASPPASAGSPVRSKVTRRMRVRLSAASDGESPFDSSFFKHVEIDRLLAPLFVFSPPGSPAF